MKTSKMRGAWALGALVLGAMAAGQARAAGNADDATLVARGEYLARAGDCIACHTAAGGKPFAGGLPIKSPMGTIYSTNITPDAEHGIGRYSEQEFAAAVRDGMRRDGKHLYPAMPYPDYQAITDSDVHALYTYFMKGVAPVAKAAPATSLSFPFNQRWGMAFWNYAFTSKQAYVPLPGAAAGSAGAASSVGAASAPKVGTDSTPVSPMDLDRGRYLVQTLGHCGSCHTPRGVGMQEKALDDSDARFLSGGSLNDWGVPSLRGMHGWTVKDITDYLSTGRNDFASVGGEMTGVVEHSMQHMTSQDLRAIAVYLKSLPADKAQSAPRLRADAQAASAKTTQQLSDAQHLSSGQLLYLNNCAACHAVSGEGAKGIFPRLNGAEIVVSENPTALIAIMLKGAQTPSTQHAPSILAMPGFAHRLSDAQVADLATFLRTGWSNDAASVSASDVAKVRKHLD